MKAEELMIGDWVQFPFGFERVQEIGFVQGHGYCASFAASATLFPVEVDKIEPILLTTEILESNGFPLDEEETKKIKSYYENYENWKLFKFPLGSGFYIEYNINKNAFWITDHGWIKFKYVHEFQHVLKLCGINKEIVL